MAQTSWSSQSVVIQRATGRTRGLCDITLSWGIDRTRTGAGAREPGYSPQNEFEHPV